MKTLSISPSPTAAVPTVAASGAAPHLVRIQAVPGIGTSSATLAGPLGDSAWTTRDRADDVAEVPRLRTGETKGVR